MGSGVVSLRLDVAVATCVLEDGDVVRHPESHFLDLVVADRSLRERAAGGGDMVTELNRPWVDLVPAAVDRLLGRRPAEDLAAGRVALLVCAVDGDPGCGRLTAALDVGDGTVSWSGFRWEDGRSAARPVDGLDEPLVFDRRQYEAAFAGAVAEVAALPHDELSHTGRRFRWPWQWGWTLARSVRGGEPPGVTAG